MFGTRTTVEAAPVLLLFVRTLASTEHRMLQPGAPNGARLSGRRNGPQRVRDPPKLNRTGALALAAATRSVNERPISGTPAALRTGIAPPLPPPQLTRKDQLMVPNGPFQLVCAGGCQ